MPAVVVGRHADHRVGDLGFAREFGFGEHGHVDDVAAPGAVEAGFGEGGELGTFYTGVSRGARGTSTAIGG